MRSGALHALYVTGAITMFIVIIWSSGLFHRLCQRFFFFFFVSSTPPRDNLTCKYSVVYPFVVYLRVRFWPNVCLFICLSSQSFYNRTQSSAYSHVLFSSSRLSLILSLTHCTFLCSGFVLLLFLPKCNLPWLSFFYCFGNMDDSRLMDDCLHLFLACTYCSSIGDSSDSSVTCLRGLWGRGSEADKWIHRYYCVSNVSIMRLLQISWEKKWVTSTTKWQQT